LVKVCLILLCLPLSGIAQVLEKSQTDHYAVDALTPLALRHQLTVRGPKDHKGQRFHGMTRSRLSWRYDKVVDKLGCRITAVQVNLNQRYTLPKWVNQAQAHFKWQKQWLSYHRALTIHEHHHGELARQAAREIDQQLLGLSKKKCRSLQRKVKKMTTKIMRDLQEQNRHYDAVSWHGVWEGVLFPRLRRRKW